MEEWFESLPGLGLGAEHGFFYRYTQPDDAP
jgi:trehalose-6-phosphatase